MVQPADGADRIISAAADRPWAVVCVAPHFDRQSAQELSVARHRNPRGCGGAVYRRDALSVFDYFAKLLLLRRDHYRDGILPRFARHRREDANRIYSGRYRTDASEHAPIWRVSGTHGNRAHVRR